jgi:hypothetical protein
VVNGGGHRGVAASEPGCRARRWGEEEEGVGADKVFEEAIVGGLVARGVTVPVTNEKDWSAMVSLPKLRGDGIVDTGGKLNVQAGDVDIAEQGVGVAASGDKGDPELVGTGMGYGEPNGLQKGFSNKPCKSADTRGWVGM